ncbi:MAG: peptidylprolyl isomerase [Pseudomonadales bacterium]
MLSRILRDPLTVFIFLGLLIFVGQGLFASNEEYDIQVRPADIARLHDQWSMQMRRPPTDSELAGLVEQFVKEEIYYREAKRLGLDLNDTIVRRRLVQKLTFLTEDIATAVAPSEAELTAYYEQNKAAYTVPERVSFKHRYFSSDRRSDARADATAALGDAEQADDPFMLQREYAARSEREIGDLFGRAFATALFELSPAEEWQGPIQSAYGWHAVYLLNKSESRIPPLEEVYDRVVVDAKQATRQAANEDYFKQLKAAYEVSYPAEFSTPTAGE